MEIKGDGEVTSEGAVGTPAAPSLPAGPRAFTCPECRQEFPTPEALGTHIERHMPTVLPGTENGSFTCPKGCGRTLPKHFPRDRNDGESLFSVKGHVALCDGSPPIAAGAAGATGEARDGKAGEKPKEETVAAKLICRKDCGKKFSKEAWREKHEAKCRGAGATSHAPSARAAAAAKRFSASRETRRKVEAVLREDRVIDAGATAIEEALVGLRAKRQAILDGLPELQDLNKAIAALEAIAGPPEDPS